MTCDSHSTSACPTGHLRTPRPLASTGLRLPTLGFGAAAIGNLYSAVEDEAAEEAVAEALRHGILYFDTAPFYGYGLSERRLGRALARHPSEGVILSTKVGRLLEPVEPGSMSTDGFAVSGQRAVIDYSRSGVRRSFEASLQRLQRERVDILLLHDVGATTHGDLHAQRLKQALDEALPAMAELKAMGACRAIGIGVNEAAVCMEIMPRFELDCILLAGRYTLLEQASLTSVMAEAHRRHVGILIGGPFNSGLLANPTAPGSTYDYARVDAATLQRAQRIYDICAAEKVDVGAAALQFPLAHPAVVTVIAGMRSSAEVHSAAERLCARLPKSLWEALRRAGILSPEAPTP